MREAIAAGREVHVQILNYRKSGEPFWLDLAIVPVRDDAGAISHWIAIGRDITKHKAQEQALARYAMEDHLTGLINRRAAEERLRIEWNRAKRDNRKFAVAIVDIDRFKLINDQYGHKVGDQALIHVSKLLSANLRGGDWLSRWGGEEFLMCFHGLDGRGALTAGERTRKLVRSRPFAHEDGELPITVSIGISVFSGDTQTLETMLTEADVLLYEAKNTGRDRTVCAGLNEVRESGFIWEGSQIQSALHESRVRPAYQPIVDLRSGQVVGEEALARIVTRSNEIITAQNFIQTAETLHLVGAIDRVVSTEALARTALSLERGRTGHAHFINLSAQFLSDAESVAELLDRSTAFAMLGKGGAGNPVVIEITERQTADIAVLRRNLKPLVDAGFRLAVDDFGSGYSSFLYLASLDVNFLKIEGWMVNRILKSARVRQLVQTIVNTAQTFHLKTVAECVEDASTAQVLCDIGVDWAQGYYFAHPAMDSGAATSSV
jgi:diguanylate cyclase (GGDEF)-like protein